MARRPTRPTPEPLDVDAVSVVTIGTLLWALAGLALAVFARGWLERNHDVWWVWTCVSGFLLGLAGIIYVRRRRSALGRLGAARGEQPVGPQVSPVSPVERVEQPQPGDAGTVLSDPS
jgi:hypothetical protein